MTGQVASFDSPRGYGVIAADDGTEVTFHCTAIADGSREIEPGTAVTFDLVASHLGRWEAAAVTPA